MVDVAVSCDVGPASSTCLIVATPHILPCKCTVCLTRFFVAPGFGPPCVYALTRIPQKPDLMHPGSEFLGSTVEMPHVRCLVLLFTTTTALMSQRVTAVTVQ